MAGPLIDLRLQDEEVLLYLDRLPKRLRAALASKLEAMMDQVRADFLKSVPGKYLDPSLAVSGVAHLSPTSVSGYIEINQKEGLYTITAKGRALAFIGKRDGALVFRKQVSHPYPKLGPNLIRQMVELKPWLEDQLYDTVIEAL